MAIVRVPMKIMAMVQIVIPAAFLNVYRCGKGVWASFHHMPLTETGFPTGAHCNQPEIFVPYAAGVELQSAGGVQMIAGKQHEQKHSSPEPKSMQSTVFSSSV